MPNPAKVKTEQFFKINHPNLILKIRANSGFGWGWWTTCVHARIQNFWLEQTTQNFEQNFETRKLIVQEGDPGPPQLLQNSYLGQKLDSHLYILEVD